MSPKNKCQTVAVACYFSYFCRKKGKEEEKKKEWREKYVSNLKRSDSGVATGDV